MTDTDRRRAQRALFRALRTPGEARRLANYIGVDCSLPGRWATGERNPTADSGARDAIFELYQIPQSWWILNRTGKRVSK